MRRTILALSLLALLACDSTSEGRKPLDIVAGQAHIFLVQARSSNGKIVFADWTATSSGYLLVGSGGNLYGQFTINGTTSIVSGSVVELLNGLRFDIPGLPPGSFIVHTDASLDQMYALFGFYDQIGDVTGDGIAETYRLYIELRK